MTGLGTSRPSRPTFPKCGRVRRALCRRGYPIWSPKTAVLPVMPTPMSFAHARRIAAPSKTLFTSRTMQSGWYRPALLNGVIDRCTVLGLRQMLAVIGDSHNAASIGAHRACGFSYVGVLTWSAGSSIAGSTWSSCSAPLVRAMHRFEVVLRRSSFVCAFIPSFATLARYLLAFSRVALVIQLDTCKRYLKRSDCCHWYTYTEIE